MSMTPLSQRTPRGQKLPDSAKYLDQRFLLELPNGQIVEHGWDGTRWVTNDQIYLVEESMKERDQPAKLKPEGTPIPLRIVAL